jgi:hypothetical protein
MAVANFLQISDLHLGRPFGWLPAERARARRLDQQRALENAVREGIERGVHAILLPGDLFDAEVVDADTLAFALHAFRVAGCPPVFIAPGNHDPLSATGPTWNARLLAARGFAWPAHVHVFDTPRWSARSLAALPGVRVWGRCFASHAITAERPLSKEALAHVGSADHSGFDIALFHGSREEQCPPGQKITAPFSDAEVQQSPFAYLAAGHYHGAQRLTADGGRSAGVQLAYAGSAVGLDITETGVHGALEVRVEYGFRVPFVEIDLVQLDPRRIFDLTADVTGIASAEQVDQRVLRALDTAAATAEDIATVRLRGRLVRGVRYGGPGPALRDRLFHLRLDLREVRPDYDLEAYRGGEGATTEDRFARTLLDDLDRETDPARRAVIRDALDYGLDAFKLREVVPTWDEVAES